MPLLAIGLSHHTAPLDVREKLAIGNHDYAEKLNELLSLEGVGEAVILSTCNRTEVYTAVAAEDIAHPLNWLVQQGGLDAQSGNSMFYSKYGDDAVRHLFRVACGLDSMVLGEPQIMGQLKQAWHASREAGGAGKLTDRLFQRAFSISKEVRSETGINDHPVSVAYIASVLARQIFGDLSRKTVMMVGAGEMISLCGQHFHHHGVGQLLIANRSLERAKEVGEPWKAEAMTLEQMQSRLPEADVLICCTAATEPLIRKSSIEVALRKRKRQPIFMVDLGVPRDIEPSISGLRDVYLYSIDDLRQVADEGLNKRQQAAQDAVARIESAVTEYLRWMHGARAAEGLRKLRLHAEQSGAQLAERALHQIQSGGDPALVVQQLSNTLTHRILHGPSTRLREAAEQQQDNILRAADWLFDHGEPGLPEDSGDEGDETPA